jgi:hypothetical protein
MMRWLLLLVPVWLVAYEGSEVETEPIKPWFTGPLIASSGNTTSAGHVNFEPYVYSIARTSYYNNDWQSDAIDTLWNLQFRTPLWIGITNWLDVKLAPGWNWNERNGVSCWSIADFGLQLDFALHKDTLPHKHWYPSIKLSLRENFPTGKYQNLNPNKFGTDAGGRGCYTTFIAINTSKMIQIRDYHFLNLFFDVVYGVPTTVHVKGFNVYGGGYGTDGVITPENTFFTVFAFEYSLTRNWAVACDFLATVVSKTKFRGIAGVIPSDDLDVDPVGIPAVNEVKAGIQYTISPAIEYNWSANLGIIAGAWLSIAGKNASNFTGGVIALNYYH